MLTWNRITASTAVVLTLILAGCANMQSHDETANRVQAAGRAGDFKAALVQLDERHASADAKKE
jgi:outer membrane murein-binding lipoprotein Lpp